MVTPMHLSPPSGASTQTERAHFGAGAHDSRAQLCANAHNDGAACVEVDLPAAAKLAVHLVRNGSDALVLSGTTGEAPTTHIEEKAQLIQTVRQALLHAFPERHIPLIAGTGSNDTVHAIRNTEVAAEAGADVVLVVTPYYSRPSQAGVLEHYKAVGASTQLPVILYDVPGRSGVTIEPDTYAQLAEIPNVVAVKDATGNVYRALKVLQAMNEVRALKGLPDVTLYAGDDTLLLPFLAVGARGIISVAAHLEGVRFRQAVEQFRAGETTRALETFQETLYAIDLCNDSGQQAACTKAALQAQGAIPERTMRLPNIALDDAAYDLIKERLK